MNYIIAPKEQALRAGFAKIGHRTHKESILLNEKEVLNNPHLSGSITQRTAQLGGKLYNETQVINHIKNENWK